MTMNLGGRPKSNGNHTTAKQRLDAQVMERIGLKLGRIRRERGMSQTEIARASGRPPSAVHRAEQGWGVTVPALLDFADALDCNVYDLIPCGDGDADV
jgi:transcriptional regulator with XRE-family HTH domain